ncbi:MAG TPA: hypothetical protein GXZ76_02480 [Clostridiaceae bacterium]|jgi:hypothetical protein|nr:hypothetical protein [Clostridiaceae bacterium]
MNQSSKSRYFLVELLVNCLLFAVAAAICIAIFAHGNMTGKKSAALSMAVAEAQNVAESVKAAGGDLQVLDTLLDTGEEEGVYILRYDTDWRRLPDGADPVYELRTVIDIDEKNMLQADISVTDKEGIIYTLRVLRYLGAKSGGKI